MSMHPSKVDPEIGYQKIDLPKKGKDVASINTKYTSTAVTSMCTQKGKTGRGSIQ